MFVGQLDLEHVLKRGKEQDWPTFGYETNMNKGAEACEALLEGLPVLLRGLEKRGERVSVTRTPLNTLKTPQNTLQYTKR